MVSVPPASFRHELTDDWALWVFDHGLPRLLADLGRDDEVPIASWAGPEFAAVVFRSLDGAEVDDTAVPYRRVNGTWEALGGDGGAAGALDDPLSPLRVDPGFARLGVGGRVDQCEFVTGIVGRAAEWVELNDRHGLTRRRLHAPVSVFVVTFHCADEVTIRIRDPHENVLLEQTLGP